MKAHRLLFRRTLPVFLFAGAVLALGTSAGHGGAGDGDDDDGDDDEIQLEVAQIFFEYNSTDNDLGVHVFLDGEDWKKMKITKPNGHKIFEVKGKGPYATFGMTELFFEG